MIYFLIFFALSMTPLSSGAEAYLQISDQMGNTVPAAPIQYTYIRDGQLQMMRQGGGVCVISQELASKQRTYLSDIVELISRAKPGPSNVTVECRVTGLSLHADSFSVLVNY